MQSKFALLLALLTLVGAMPLLSACYTTAGAGQDLQAAGHGIEKSADRNTNYRPERQSGRSIMDNDRLAGSAKQAKGKVKESWGKITGDAKTETEGKADQAEGRVQNAVGGAKDAARELREKISGRE